MVMNSHEKERHILSLRASAVAFDSHINGAGPHKSPRPEPCTLKVGVFLTP